MKLVVSYQKESISLKVSVSPSKISGRLKAPPSKSSMQRAVAAALLSSGESLILNPSLCEDSLAALKMAECLGAAISMGDDSVLIKGGLRGGCRTLDCNESGLGARLFSAIAALGNEPVTIEGKRSLLMRPMDDGVSCLRSLGVISDSNGGFLPIMVCGPLKGGTAFLDGSMSSQFLTGLLMALPLSTENSRLIVKDLSSRAYIDMTIDILSRFGITIFNDNYKEFTIEGNQIYRAQKYMVEGDWSGSAFLLVMGALSEGIVVDGLQITSTQPDRNIISCLRMAGVDVKTERDIISVKGGTLKGFEADISDSPDLAPPLVALAAYCKGNTVIRGTERLKVKESDRGAVLESEMRKLGVDITNYSDHILIRGGARIRGGTVSSHGDHRIAMALSVIAPGAESDIIIENGEAVNKSYPGFYKDFISAGAACKLII